MFKWPTWLWIKTSFFHAPNFTKKYLHIFHNLLNKDMTVSVKVKSGNIIYVISVVGIIIMTIDKFRCYQKSFWTKIKLV